MAQWIDSVKFGNGSEGTPAAYNQGWGICTGTAGSTTLTVTDVHAVWQIVANNVVLIHQSQGTGAGQWELNVATGTLGTGNHTMKYPLTYTYGAGAQIVRVPQFTGGTLSANLTPTSSWNGSWGGIVAIMSSGDLTISGSLSVSGGGFRGGAQRQDYAYTGEGDVGATFLVTADYQRNGNGGSGGHHASPPDNIAVVGSGGGNGVAGGNGYYSYGGTTSGNAGLTNMTFGGGGGGGSKGNNNGGIAGNGANGGGAIFIFAKNLTVSGSVITAGNIGQYGPDTSHGGSGAGGSILVKCQSAIIGTNKVTSSGGVAVDSGAQVGGAGRIHIDYYSSYTGTTTPTIDAAQDTNLKSQVYTSMI